MPNDVCDHRAREAVANLVKTAEKLKVSLNIENIFFNGYLMTPMEMNAFVDSFSSPAVRVHFDTGNIMLFQYPEHWIPILGKRIANTHFKEFTKKGTDHSLESFRPLLDGTTNWPAVMDALDGDRLSRLLHVRVLPSVPALSRSADLSDIGLAGSDAREEGTPLAESRPSCRACCFGSDFSRCWYCFSPECR